jgi:multimeric flavodoxin WrbA
MVVDTVEVNFLAKEYGDIFCEGMTISYSWKGKGRNQEPSRPPCDRPVNRPLEVLAINTCPEKGKGNIARLLDPYLEGMTEAGASVELYYAHDLTIFPCCGNLNCTISTPGNCMAYDDMRWLRPKIGHADVLVLASPLYFNGMTGPEGMTASMKSLQDMLVPEMEPSMDRPYEHAVHTTREAVSLRKVVFVSGCGFWEVDGLNPVLTHIKAFCMNSYPAFEGNIPEPRGAILRGALKGDASGSEVIQIAREAGRMLVLEDKFPSMRMLSTPPPRRASHAKREWANVILYQF